MAKKKPPAPSDDRESLTTLKGSSEWVAWVRRLADHDRNTVVGLVDRALAEYAQAHGFKEDPPKR
jgi:hypothetical protein